jgi:hypothetical protein
MKAMVRLLLVWVLGLAALAGTASQAASAKAAARHDPVVVELFTSQGCSSCKQANSFIAKLADRPDLIVLMWPVDYWDYLGWKDTFAQPDFAARQKLFAHRLGPEDVYTPQVVVNGRKQVSGDDETAVSALIRAIDPPRRRPPRIRKLASGRVSVGAGRLPLDHADVWLVRYDPRQQDVDIKAGDNRGATVVQRNVVEQIVRLGTWRGRPVVFKTPEAPATKLAEVVLIEGPRGGPILAASELK